MVKKKILMLTVVFMLVCGVVSASSINGMFHSEEIVKVTANGKELKVEDVPGVLYHDRTVLPLYMFKELGVQLTWDLEKQSVDIKMPEPAKQNSIDDISVEAKKHNVSIVNYATSGDGKPGVLTFYYDLSFDDPKYQTDFSQIIDLALLTKSSQIRIYEMKTGRIFNVDTQSVKDFNSGLISADELAKKYFVYDANSFPSGANNQLPQNTTPAPAALESPSVYSSDGKTYLGKLTSSQYDSDSIFNEYGSYGGKYSSTSIWNEYGTYGGQFSNESAFNDLATKPPIIILGGKVVGHLTTNDVGFTDAISPNGLKEILVKMGY